MRDGLGPQGARLEVLLQRRAEGTQYMPGYIGSVGGMRDRTDNDSRETVAREVNEECGLEAGVVIPPIKFAEGGNCDWYVMKVQNPTFARRAETMYECSDIRKALPYMPQSVQLAECFGHCWLPVDEIGNIHEQQPLMGGLVNRVRWGARHLEVVSRSFPSTHSPPSSQPPEEQAPWQPDDRHTAQGYQSHLSSSKGQQKGPGKGKGKGQTGSYLGHQAPEAPEGKTHAPDWCTCFSFLDTTGGTTSSRSWR